MVLRASYRSCINSIRSMESTEEISGKTTLKSKKAIWTPITHEIFVDLCLEQISKGNRPGKNFTKEGWRNIKDSFHKMSGFRYNRLQLKNHWDNTKKQWKVWHKLISTSTMKWDPNTQIFGASEEDWTDYMQRNPEAAQFQLKQLPLSSKLNDLFVGTLVRGETERPACHRKCNNDSTAVLSHKRVEEASKPEAGTEQIYDAVETRSVVTVQSSPAKRNYSIEECIECLDTIEEVEQGSGLYLFALDIFLKKEYREIFLNLKKPSVRVAWLQRLHSRGPSLPLY